MTFDTFDRSDFCACEETTSSLKINKVCMNRKIISNVKYTYIWEALITSETHL